MNTTTHFIVYENGRIYHPLESEEEAVAYINRDGYRHMEARKEVWSDCSTGRWDGYMVESSEIIKAPEIKVFEVLKRWYGVVFDPKKIFLTNQIL